MTIWADADSLPAPVRDLIVRRTRNRSDPAEKSGESRAVFVANRPLPVPPGADLIVVDDAGADAVDERILALAVPGDLAVTRDIPFAARLVGAGVTVINDRGDTWTEDNIRERLAQRDFMADLRAAGLADMRRSRMYGPRELRAFADALDRALQRLRSVPRTESGEGA